MLNKLLPCQIQPWASHTDATVFRAPSQKSVSYAWRNRCLKEVYIRTICYKGIDNMKNLGTYGMDIKTELNKQCESVE